ncbi:ABC transporter permease [Cryobacterium sp. SO2]|uniref:ABC transporter permease n=1 Tax=Cryobacterium sp. SO2 TaxID=1897060 RepID=UPI0023DC4B08|nr:ABC transporter permease [Cryobacterium sp. SO2]WEO75969.1 ABC transporter permease [Cryobacterium sp. SO2]
MNWLSQNLDRILELTAAHLSLVLPAILLSLLVAVPLGRIVNGLRRVRGPALGAIGVLYAIPALPMFILVPSIFGTGLRSPATAVIVLTAYGVAILTRSAGDAFESVPQSALAAASSVGYSPWRRFWDVELPLASPILIAGLRVVSVSTVSLATIGALTGVSSLGTLFTDGFQRGIVGEVVTGLVLTVMIAVAIDLILAVLGRALTPWLQASPRKDKANVVVG